MVVTIVGPLGVAGVWTVVGSDVTVPQYIRVVLMEPLLHVGIKVVRAAGAEIDGTFTTPEQTVIDKRTVQHAIRNNVTPRTSILPVE